MEEEFMFENIVIVFQKGQRDIPYSLGRKLVKGSCEKPIISKGDEIATLKYTQLHHIINNLKIKHKCRTSQHI